MECGYMCNSSGHRGIDLINMIAIDVVIYKENILSILGKPINTKSDIFWTMSKRGDGGHFQSKKLYCRCFL